MQIAKLIRILEPIIIKRNLAPNTESLEINNFVIDSRIVAKNDCFIPLKGEKTDGHYYIKDAIKRGAVCALASYKFSFIKELPQEYQKKLIIIKTSGLNAIRKIAKENVRKYITRYNFAITGTSGKTTTKEVLAFMLRKLNHTVFVPQKGLNGEIGTPLALANLNKYFEFAVLEFATAKFGEILSQARVARPDTAILITVGHAHTQFLKDIHGVKKAKGEIFTKAKKAILPDILNKEYKKILPKKNMTFGYTNHADIKISDIKITSKGTLGTIYYKGKKYSVYIPLYHAHILENISAALGALIINNIVNEKNIKKTLMYLKTFNPPNQRGVIRYYTYKRTKITFADYTYNANEVSIRNTVDTLESIQTNLPKILYIADVLELGKLEKQQHEQFAYQLKRLKNHVQAIFFQGELMEITYKKLKELAPNLHTFHSKDSYKLHKKLNTIVEKYPKVLVWAIGSHGMKTWEITKNWHEHQRN